MKKQTLALLSTIFISSLFAASTKQELVHTIKDIDAPLWHQTVSAPTSDPALLLSPTLSTLPGLPATSTLFFCRTPVVAKFTDLLNNDALHRIALNSIEENEKIATLKQHLDAISVQEHTIGMQLGQQWQQDNWEVSWQWWLGVRERHMWLDSKNRKELRTLLKDSPASVLGVSAWRSTTITPGVGDVHIAARYRLALGSLFSLSLGIHGLLPTATKQKNTADDTAALPLEAEKFTAQLAKRARDIMLCAPFGSNGSTGIGLSATAQLNLTDNLKLIGEITSLRFRPHTQQRYALKQTDKVPFLVEGEADTQAGISTDEDISTYLEHYLYPRQQETKITTGAIHVASVHLAHTADSFHNAIGYRQELHEPDQADNAPDGTLRLSPTQQHQLAFTSSVNREHDWGNTSSYLTAHYTIAGTHTGSWSIGFGATVQA